MAAITSEIRRLHQTMCIQLKNNPVNFYESFIPIRFETTEP